MAEVDEEPTDGTPERARARPEVTNRGHDMASIVQAGYLGSRNVSVGHGSQHNGNIYHTYNTTHVYLPMQPAEALPPKDRSPSPEPIGQRGVECSGCQRRDVLILDLRIALGVIMMMLLTWGVIRATRHVL
ncbi:hypothetical protein FALBO_11575 [Fusarium albosuccineum]|uniref:Uncharacterized protein n=1 Tax=Fusarium albosuccineum TaxID=1237068 RepID=A0A8H4L4S6_9HYPO|nr:hypothetical protein FALBO_11575 [Fusarium albosuccineum]